MFENVKSLNMRGAGIALGIAVAAASFSMPSVAKAGELEDAQAAVAAAQQKVDSSTEAVNDAQGRIDDIDIRLRSMDDRIAELERKLGEHSTGAVSCHDTDAGTVGMIMGNGADSQAVVSLRSRSELASYYQGAIDDLDEQRQMLSSDRAGLARQRNDSQAALDAGNAELSDAQSNLDAVEQRIAEEKARAAAEAAARAQRGSSRSYSGGSSSYSGSDDSLSVQQMRRQGVAYANGYRYTYYEESVLPGGGLDIPGRHHDGGKVVDGDGYVAVASSDLAKGTVVDTPLGKGKVYDSGCASGTIDLYLQ